MGTQRAEFLSPQGLADLLELPLSTIYSWRHKGYGPPGINVGRHVRYRKADIDGWLQSLQEAERAS